jgi:hypothetical protein
VPQAWNKEKLHHKAFNVLHMIQKWNETSMWVISLILEPVKAKYRAKRWESLIKIAKVPPPARHDTTRHDTHRTTRTAHDARSLTISSLFVGRSTWSE